MTGSAYASAVVSMAGSAAVSSESFLSRIASSLIGVFVGAWLAYLVQDSRERNLKDEKEGGIILETLTELAQQLHTLLTTEARHLGPNRGNASRHRLMGRYLFAIRDAQISGRSIAFVVTNNETAQLLIDLGRCQRYYASAFDALELRNEFVTKLADSKDIYEDFTDNKVNITTQDSLRLKLLTDTLYEAVDKAIELNRLVMTGLQEVGKVRYPRHPFFWRTDDVKIAKLKSN